MGTFVSIVDLSNGLVSECLSDVSTFDAPAALDSGASEVSLDGHGLLHFAGPDGGPATELANEGLVSARNPGEPFLARGGDHEHDEHGWQLYRLCVREP